MSKFAIASMIMCLLYGLVCTDGRWQPLMKDNESLAKVLDQMCQEYNQPAIAAALVLGDSIIMQAAVGNIVFSEEDQVKADSRFHIGSITKSFTAVLVAMFVKREH